MVESATIRQLRERTSVRDFAPDPVDDDTIAELLQAACRAPTSDNLQAYSFIIVRDEGKRRALAALAGGQAHIQAAPIFIALCADLARLEAACGKHQQPLTSISLELKLVTAIDGAIAGTALCLAAESIGLGTVMIGGMRNKPIDVAVLLRLPPRVFVLFGICIGWPRTVPAQQPRLPMSALAFNEHYDRTAACSGIEEHDRATAAHRASMGRQGGDAAWSSRVAQVIGLDRRRDLASQLTILGWNPE